LLINEIATKGPNINLDTAEILISNKEKSLPLLINLIGKIEVWEPPYKKYSAWTPVAIIHLLSLIGGKDAFEAVKNAVVIYYDEMGDWITEDFPSVIATFGPEVFNQISKVIADTTIDEWIRVGLARSLRMISMTFPDLGEKSAKMLKEVISQEKKNRNTRTLLTIELSYFKDQESFSFIKQLFIDGLLDESVLEYDEVCDVYEGENDYLETDKIKNPFHIFKEDSFYRRTNYGDFLEKQVVDTTSNNLSRKIGRDDPCPCGSGKKYKKCCM
jgi:hypothetical protein